VKILYFYQYFSTPEGAWGTRVYEFAKKWVEQGHDVTVVTSIYSKSDLSSSKLLDTQFFDGIKVKIINVKIDNKQKIIRRVWTWLVYMFFSCWYAITLSADIVIASSGPITVAIPGLLAHYIRRRKFVFEARDIWPQTAIELGLLRNKYLIKFFYWLEKKSYNASCHVIALSDGMVTNILNRYPHVKVTSVPNSANIQLFSVPSSSDIGEWKTKKYAIYTGNIGTVNNSELLYNAAVELKNKNRQDIFILLVGDGQQKEELKRAAMGKEINNFVIKDLMAKKDLVAYIQHSMVSLVPLKANPILDTSSPNKFYESLAAGVPVIQTTNGWMKDFLNNHNIGFTIPADASHLLAEWLIKIADNKVDLFSMKERAKKIAGEHFNKDVLSERMLNVLKTVYLD